MKKTLLYILLQLSLGVVLLSAQDYCEQPELFVDDQNYDALEEYFDIVYKTAEDYKEETINLKVDIRTPPNLTEKRPLVIAIHGGAFLNVTLGETGNAYSKKVATEFANKGFVTADIGYRLGWKNGLGGPYSANYTDGEESFKAAYHRALQDLTTAINFLETHADEYNIDTDNIFLFGRSAGAILSLAAAYTQENELDPEFVELLGGLDGPVNIKGIVAVSGSLLNLEDLNSGEQIPSLMIHGTCDHIVPYGSKNFLYCNDSLGFGLPDALLSHGAYSIANHMSTLNMPYQLFELCNTGHEISNNVENGTIIAAAAFFKDKILCNSTIETFQERYTYEVDAYTATLGGCIFNDFLDCHEYGIVEDFGDSLFITGNTNVVDTTNTTIATIQKPSIKVYPNPTTDLLVIETQIPLQKIELYDILGNLLYQETEPKQKNSLYISNLASGVYYLTLEWENDILSKKVIVE